MAGGRKISHRATVQPELTGPPRLIQMKNSIDNLTWTQLKSAVARLSVMRSSYVFGNRKLRVWVSAGKGPDFSFSENNCRLGRAPCVDSECEKFSHFSDGFMYFDTGNDSATL